MAARVPLSRKTRFEVFKRDKFTCQFCGAKAPDVLLQVDHLNPVSAGGDNEILNLVTACQPCNAGKGPRKLTDAAVLERQLTQMAALEERREQLEMLLDWHRSLADLEEQSFADIAAFWSDIAPGQRLTPNGEDALRRLLASFTVVEVLEAMRIAARQYFKRDAQGNVTTASASLAWSKLGGICNNRRREQADPVVRDINFARGILQRSLSYYDDRGARVLLRSAFDVGATADEVFELARSSRSWSNWKHDMEYLIEEKTSS